MLEKRGDLRLGRLLPRLKTEHLIARCFGQSVTLTIRRGGTFVAVRAPNERRAEQARAVLRQHGAEHVADFTAAL